MVQPEEQARLYPPRPELLPAAHVPSLPHYERLYQRSVEEPQGEGTGMGPGGCGLGEGGAGGGGRAAVRLFLTSGSGVAEFWGDIAKEFYWKRQHPGPFLKYNFDVTKGKIFIEWMKGATTNICYNLLDRNVGEKKLGDKIAFYW